MTKNGNSVRGEGLGVRRKTVKNKLTADWRSFFLMLITDHC
jgi:hypothetical protein